MYKFINKIIREFGNTGERPILEKKIEDIASDLSFAYQFSSNYVVDKKVLDFGCGGGYGTEYLSRFTKKDVVGFDKDDNTIKINNNYFHSKKLSFCSKLPNKKFDVITSFQVIEHIKTRKKYYHNLCKLLNKNGIIIISTPNKNLTSYGLKKPAMVFHELEFDPNSLKKELSQNFKNVEIYGQIDKKNEKLVKENKYNYVDTVKSYSWRIHLTWFVSQIELVRTISRHLPMFIKYLFMGKSKDKNEIKFTLVSEKLLVENSFGLIAILRK